MHILNVMPKVLIQFKPTKTENKQINTTHEKIISYLP